MLLSTGGISIKGLLRSDRPVAMSVGNCLGCRSMLGGGAQLTVGGGTLEQVVGVCQKAGPAPGRS